MCPNRVEELEASVEGLTDELVECKVRIRELEVAVDADLGFAPERAGPRPEPELEAEPADTTKPEAPEETDKTEDPEAEIIVA